MATEDPSTRAPSERDIQLSFFTMKITALQTQISHLAQELDYCLLAKSRIEANTTDE